MKRVFTEPSRKHVRIDADTLRELNEGAEKAVLHERQSDWLFHTSTLSFLPRIARDQELHPRAQFEGGGAFVSLSASPMVGAFGDTVLVFRKRSVAARLLKVQYTKNFIKQYPKHTKYVTNLPPVDDYFGKKYTDRDQWEILKDRDFEEEWITRKEGATFPFGEGELVAVLCGDSCSPTKINRIRKWFAHLLPPHYVTTEKIGMELIRTGKPVLRKGADPTRADILKMKPAGGIRKLVASVTEMAVVDTTKFDLKTLYQKYNRELFAGDLPPASTLKLGFSNRMKRATGMAKARATFTPQIRTLGKRGIAMRQPLERGVDYVIQNGTLSITMSTKLRYEEKDFFAAFIHEMIHIYLYWHGWPMEDHGQEFQRIATRMSAKSGLHIPLTHEMRGNEEIAHDAKKLGLLIASPPALRGERQSDDGKTFFTLMNPNYVHDWAAKAIDYVQTLRKDIRVYTLATQAGSVLTVKREPPRRGFSMFAMNPKVSALLDMSKATLIADIPYTPPSMRKAAASSPPLSINVKPKPKGIPITIRPR